MTSERSLRIEQLLQAARNLQQPDRDHFLQQACGDDQDLRQQVESLLGNHKSSPPVDRPKPVPGTLLGPYEIEGPLGAGGMGEVFRARDTRLNRNVAVKVLHARFDDRFDREARAISSLNHPHICTLYDVGPDFLVMELLEGETLAARIRKGPLPLDAVLQFGAQIASALGAAHGKGIVHRDVKPGNIMLTRAGVKVLDFGLAKETADETMTLGVLGTPAYMSPEQRQGSRCDHRTDIYALGLILREMSSGKRDASAPGTEPLQLTQLVERCLRDDPEDRWQSASDLANVLEWSRTQSLSSTSSTPHVAAPRVSSRVWLIATAALLLCLFAAVIAWKAFLPKTAAPRLSGSHLQFPPKVSSPTPGNSAAHQPFHPMAKPSSSRSPPVAAPPCGCEGSTSIALSVSTVRKAPPASPSGRPTVTTSPSSPMAS